MSRALIVAGIDVGAPKKGFHAVALKNGADFDKLATRDTKEAAEWCRGVGAQLIGVDAPCCWSTAGKPRPAELELMRDGIWCFSTPTRRTAETHPTNYYGWMLNGEALFAELKLTHPLFNRSLGARPGPMCFETFPHAIACFLAGRVVPAKAKRVLRRKLLETAGVETSPFTNIDWLDAALCALTAHCLGVNKFELFGEASTGYIIVPAGPNQSLHRQDRQH